MTTTQTANKLNNEKAQIIAELRYARSAKNTALIAKLEAELKSYDLRIAELTRDDRA